MSRSRRVGAISLVLVVASLLVFAGREGFLYYDTYAKAFAFDRSVARTDESIQRHRKQFVEDQAYAASLRLFARRSGARDAGPVIGPRIHWVTVKPGKLEYRTLSDRAIDRELYERLGNDWLSAAPELWRGLDFGWMGQLAQLDYWDLEQNSISEPTDISGPVPELSDLLAWSELRLARGLHEKALPSAVAEVEELARLCFTTESFSIQLDGIALLSLVRTAQKRAGGSPPGPDLGRIQRALFGASAFARLETPTEHAGSFDQLQVGRCAALQDGMRTALFLRNDLRESRSAEYRRLEDHLARSHDCRLRWLRARWPLPDDASLQGDAWWERALWRWSPAWRRIQGEILVAIGALDWFRGYELQSTRK